MRRAPDQRDVFALLGVDAKASWEDVQRAFRTAVRGSHPDVHTDDPDAERRLKALNAAWESINTPSKWAAYVLPVPSAADSGRPAPPAASTSPLLGRLRIRRQLRGSAGLANWQLELDGEVVASIENGGTSTVDIEPGRHSLRVFYGGRSSVALTVHLRRGHELVVGCRQLEDLRTSLFSPKRSLVLEVLGSEPFA
jgi:hypothetical protein